MSNLYPPVPPKDEDALTDPRREDEMPPATGNEPVIGGTASVAKDEAAHLGEQAAESGQKVAGVAKDEAAKVATEVRVQVSDLFSEAKEQLNEQATSQQERVAAGLHSISEELQRMADNSDEDGMATDLVRQAAAKTGSVASWLGDRDPGSLLEEARRFAREKPGTFIAIAAAAGVLAGRLTRSVASEIAESHESSAGPDVTAHTMPPTGAGSTTEGPAGTLANSVNVDPDIQAGSATPIYNQTEARSAEGGDLR